MRRYKPDSVRTPYDIADMNFEHICAIGSLSETEKITTNRVVLPAIRK